MNGRRGAQARILGHAFVVAGGCVAAALLHLAIGLEGDYGGGPGMSHAYAHLFVTPLLLSGAGVALAIAFAYALRGSACGVARRGFIGFCIRVAVTACVVLIATEHVEQFISLGHVLDAISVGTPFTVAFAAQLCVVSAGVAALLQFALRVCFEAVRIASDFIAAYRSACPPRCALAALPSEFSRTRRSALFVRCVSRRGPPTLLIA